MLPKIAIITPTFNAGKNIEQCLKSVADQKYANKEHLIIDGSSTDQTMEIVKKYAKIYQHIKWISEKDAGIYDAMNKGLDRSAGDWVHFLGSDDIFFNEDVLNEVFAKSDDCKRFDFLYGDVMWGDTDKTYDGKFSSLKIMKKNICHQAIFFKNELFTKFGRFNLRYKSLADWEFNIRMFGQDDVRKKYMEKTIVKYGLGGFSHLYRDADFYNDCEDIFKANLSFEWETFSQLRSEAEKNKNDNDKLRKELSLLKSSKFWKMRNKYIRFKKYVGK